MKRSFFHYSFGDETMYFVSTINAQGCYNPDHRLLLGTIYDLNGNHIQTTRVHWDALTPMNYCEIAKVFSSDFIYK